MCKVLFIYKNKTSERFTICWVHVYITKRIETFSTMWEIKVEQGKKLLQLVGK